VAWLLYGFTGTHDKTAPGGLTVLAHPAGAAIVGPIEPAELATDDPPTDEDQTRLIRHALAHEAVVSAVMASGRPVLPVRFGAVFTSPESVMALIERNAESIGRFLDGPGRCEEWSLKGRLDAAAARAWIDGHDPEIARVREAAPATPGARYFHEKKLKAAIEARVAGWLVEVAAAARSALVPPALEMRPLTPSRAQTLDDPRPLGVYQAYLVPPSERADWQSRLAELHSTYAPRGLELTGVGPWPPYHFAPALEGSP
jgi:hypothetical protein